MRNALNEAKEIVASVLKINKESIDNDANLFLLGLVNSIDFVELVMLIERKVGYKLSLEEILSLSSVNKIASFIGNS